MVSGNISAQFEYLADKALHKEALAIVRADQQGLPIDAIVPMQQLIERLHSQGRFIHNKVTIKHEADIHRYFQRYQDLLASIRSQGLLPLTEYKRSQSLLPKHSVRSFYLEHRETDIGVAIAADGRLYRYRGGCHRFALAQQLQLSSIPVVIKLLHYEWLQRYQAPTCKPVEAINKAITAAVDRHNQF